MYHTFQLCPLVGKPQQFSGLTATGPYKKQNYQENLLGVTSHCSIYKF
nr:MAG TPA: hypothetical protein [Caudoviricetes sp.]